MKKWYYVVIAVLMLAMLCVGCGKKADSDNDKDTGKVNSSDGGESKDSDNDSQKDSDNDAQDSSDDMSSELNAFRPPADIIDIDLDADDPTNDYISFLYDDEGRISLCFYNSNGNEVSLSYTYNDDSIQIYGFVGSIVVADETFVPQSEFDPSGKFSKHKGYFFKGIKF